jgi:hypothetical protein
LDGKRPLLSEPEYASLVKAQVAEGKVRKAISEGEGKIYSRGAKIMRDTAAVLSRFKTGGVSADDRRMLADAQTDVIEFIHDSTGKGKKPTDNDIRAVVGGLLIKIKADPVNTGFGGFPLDDEVEFEGFALAGFGKNRTISQKQLNVAFVPIDSKNPDAKMLFTRINATAVKKNVVLTDDLRQNIAGAAVTGNETRLQSLWLSAVPINPAVQSGG